MSTEVETTQKTKIKIDVTPPSLWKVIFLNDDSTPMEFVIELLTTIFRHDEKAATDLTLEIHNTGSAVVGVYSYEIAEQRGLEATQQSRTNGFPLQIQVEKE
jgi:ATP-dependent Clp protease adaptor protein ClpS